MKKNRLCSSCCPKKSGRCGNLKLLSNSISNQGAPDQSSSLSPSPRHRLVFLLTLTVLWFTVLPLFLSPFLRMLLLLHLGPPLLPMFTSNPSHTESGPCLPSLSEIFEVSAVTTLRHVPKVTQNSRASLLSDALTCRQSLWCCWLDKAVYTVEMYPFLPTRHVVVLRIVRLFSFWSLMALPH